MKYKKGTFTTVPNLKLLEGINPQAQVLYLWICHHANQEGECYPSRRILALEAGISIKSVDRMTALLVEKGILKKQLNTVGKWNKSNSYILLLEDSQSMGSVTESPPSVTESPPSVTESPELKPITKTKELNTISKDIEPTAQSTEIKVSEKKEYGNQEINTVLAFLKQKINIEAFADGTKWERIYAKHLIVLGKKIGTEEFNRRLDFLLDDDFTRKNCNKIKFVYSNIKGWIEPKPKQSAIAEI